MKTVHINETKYPIYLLEDAPNKFTKTIDIPNKLFDRCVEITRAFNDLQDELSIIYKTID